MPREKVATNTLCTKIFRAAFAKYIRNRVNADREYPGRPI